MSNTKKIAIVSVINDLVTDQRVNRTCLLLQECGYDVLLVGRSKRDSQPLSPRPYRCRRMRMFFESGPAFYAFFNLRLFFLLLFSRADLLLANDLDTLWPNFTVARWKKIRLIYDSHEIFCEVPELQANPSKKKIWEKLERSVVPRLNTCITVNESIAAYFKNRYGRPFSVLRNIPNNLVLPVIKTRAELNLPDQKKIIILQGAGINVQRGAEELVQSMAFLPDNYLLLIVGSGDVIGQLKQDATAPQIAGKVMFVPKQDAAGLKQYTLNADLGVTIDKDTNLNYHFSLPNKIFDYIHAGIPVLASRLPEIEKLVERYQIGVFIDSHEPSHIASMIRSVLESPGYQSMKQNTGRAAAENNWDNEKLVLKALIDSEP